MSRFINRFNVIALCLLLAAALAIVPAVAGSPSLLGVGGGGGPPTRNDLLSQTGTSIDANTGSPILVQ